ncbi:hypothetical protein ACH474_03340 [Nocardia rhamnosiphila]|uniref:hypothetical protein n=1 Tax=Nocardia rhamnosiphila TaxID=426716 RepID=UPI0033D6618B
MATVGSAVVAFSGVVPVAEAAPVPVRTQEQNKSRTPFVAGALELGLASVLDPESEGVTLTVAGGAVDSGDAVEFRASRGSALYYGDGREGVRGVVGFDGAIQLAKGQKKVAITAVSYDIATGSITGAVGDTAVEIAKVSEPGQAQVDKNQGSPRATVIFGEDGLVVSSGLLTAIDAALGSGFAGIVDGTEFPGQVSIDVDLRRGDTVDTALATALGLADGLDDVDLSTLLDLDLDVGLDLNF